MKKIYIIFQLFALTLAFTGCYTNIIGEDDMNTPESIDIKGIVKIEQPTDLPKNLIVETICEITTLNNDSFAVQSISCNNPQLIAIRNNNDIILMARDFYPQGVNIIIDEQSTAIALITLHPLFAPVTIKEYSELVALIMESEYYPKFYEEVKKSIKNGQDLFDIGNIYLKTAMENLLRDLSHENTFYTTWMRSISLEENGLIDYYPLFIKLEYNNIIIQNTYLSPTYKYVICKNEENEPWKTGLIPAQSGYGVLDMLSPKGRKIGLGDPTRIELPTNGNYYLYFNRSTNDFKRHTAANILSMLGFPITSIDENDGLWKFIVNNGVDKSLCDFKYDMLYFWPTVYSIYNNSISFLESKAKYIKNGELSLRIIEKMQSYYRIKDNIADCMKLAWACDAATNIQIGLTYDNGAISSNTNVSLIKIGGDKQKGYPGQKLSFPLQVCIQTTTDHSSLDRSFYAKVKFEVISGGGSVSAKIVTADDNLWASTDWTLGDNKTGETQCVKVTALDIITRKEISEAIYFTAEIAH